MVFLSEQARGPTSCAGLPCSPDWNPNPMTSRGCDWFFVPCLAWNLECRTRIRRGSRDPSNACFRFVRS